MSRSLPLNKKKIGLDTLEHSVIRQLRPLELEGAVLLLAISGGLDSMVLLQLLIRIQKVLKLEVAIAHVHHGSSGGRKGRFRHGAWELVGTLANKKGLKFYSNVYPVNKNQYPWHYDWKTQPKTQLQSEQELRNFRHRQLEGWRRQLAQYCGKTCFLTTAHHQDDLLETRMIRLIRGTGLSGLKAMSQKDKKILRPLLHLSRHQLEVYAKKKGVVWLKDPSNSQMNPLRNWLRHKWLPALEKRRPGGVESFARSLENIVSLNEQRPLGAAVMRGKGLDRQEYLKLSQESKKQVIAAYLCRLGVRGYSQGHVKEIVKRLDSTRREHRFTVLKWSWAINAEQIEAFRPEGE